MGRAGAAAVAEAHDAAKEAAKIAGLFLELRGDPGVAPPVGVSLAEQLTSSRRVTPAVGGAVSARAS
jgi:hypothetical protein